MGFFQCLLDFDVDGSRASASANGAAVCQTDVPKPAGGSGVILDDLGGDDDDDDEEEETGLTTAQAEGDSFDCYV